MTRFLMISFSTLIRVLLPQIPQNYENFNYYHVTIFPFFSYWQSLQQLFQIDKYDYPSLSNINIASSKSLEEHHDIYPFSSKTLSDLMRLLDWNHHHWTSKHLPLLPFFSSPWTPSFNITRYNKIQYIYFIIIQNTQSLKLIESWMGKSESLYL